MKKTRILLFALLFALAGCSGGKQLADDLITVDITKSLSHKKELILQDFMDVEYIPLETNDEFINQGFVQAIGKKNIIIKNQNSDGDIFIYDRSGKAVRKINHKGQSGEEYSFILGMVLDEDNNEMYINSHYERKMLVYDLEGNFNRSFTYAENTDNSFYTEISNYDKGQLICKSEYSKETGFNLISKQDGSITKEIKIPYKEKKVLAQTLEDKENNSMRWVSPGAYSTLIPHNDNWILSELSSDTVYTFLPDQSLRPFLVRSPSIQTMNPEEFLIFRLISDRYYFMETIKNAWDFSEGKGFPRTFLMYDTQEKDFFKYNVYNGDYSVKKEVYMNAFRIANSENELWCPLEASELVESYKKGRLKGKLKDIAATLNEESNPVIMLIKQK